MMSKRVGATVGCRMSHTTLPECFVATSGRTTCPTESMPASPARAESISFDLEKFTGTHHPRVHCRAGGDAFCVNALRIIDVARLIELEATILRRFGKVGLRIFRMLLLRGPLGEH